MENLETTPTEQVTQTNVAPDLWGDTPTPQAQEAAVQEIVETPVIEAPKADTTSTLPTTPVETPPTPTTPTTVEEKVIEKVVEKLPEFKDDLSKSMYEKIAAGDTKAVYEYLSQINKDYTVMSDYDVVKENLKSNNPNWTDKDIETEMKYKFGTLNQKKDLESIDKDDYPEEYEKALAYNDAIEQKELLLSRDARDARIALEAKKQSIELPKLPNTDSVPSNQPTQEEIDELNRKWEEKVIQQVPNLSDFKFNVNGEEIVYKVTDEDKAAKLAYMKDYNGEKMAKDRGWIDAEGNENPLKIAEDLLKLENFEKIMASAATQMKTTATKELVAGIKNIDLTPQNIASPQGGKTLAEEIWS